jgi:hypothetical protein
MVLLVMIALAMLSLSTVEMRSSQQGEAMKEAQANARMALMIAIGELQKEIGPDQRVTASGAIMESGSGTSGTTATHRHIAGVWDSQRADPLNPPHYSSKKSDQFRRWMVSNQDAAIVEDASFALSGVLSDRVGMLGVGALGKTADTKDFVYAGKIAVSGDRKKGKMAWVVMDEGVKARVDFSQKKTKTTDSLAERSSRLGRSERTALEKVVAGYDPVTVASEKLITFKEMDLGVGSPMGQYLHDFSVCSEGAMSNVVDGGLREDLNLLADGADIPAEFAGKHIYSGTATPQCPSDPYWKQIFDYASLYKKVTGEVLDSSGSEKLPVVQVQAPSSYDVAPDYHVESWIYKQETDNLGSSGSFNKHVWVPKLEARFHSTNLNKTKGDPYNPVSVNGSPVEIFKDPAEGMVLTPTIAKIQMIYSLVTRRAHNEWGENHSQDKLRKQTGDPERKYMLHVVYSPVVTLHNPYNVALKFDRLRVDFQNVPIAFKFYRNGQPHPNGYNPLGESANNHIKSFLMTLDGRTSRNKPKPITLLPGEVRVFSPYFESNYSWKRELGQGRGGNGTYYFDVNESYNKITLDIKSVPGWGGDGIGFEKDFLFPISDSTPARKAEYSHSDENGIGHNSHGIIGLRENDEVRVEYQPYAPKNAEERFMVVVSTADAETGEPLQRIGAVEMDYEDVNTLKGLLPAPKGKSYQYPQAGEPGVTCAAMFEDNSTLLSEYERARPFCMFSAYAKTVKGGTDGDAEGRFGTKVWSFTNPLSLVSSAKLKGSHGSHYTYELNMEPLPGNALTQVEIDAKNRGRFVTGHTSIYGVKFGTHSEVPIAPIPSVAALQNANLNASGYLPKFDYPVANSYAHPLLKTNGKNDDGVMLDHSYLLNYYLYDRFYCSSVAAYSGGMFASNATRTTREVLEDFLKGDSEKHLLDRRFIPWKSGKTNDEILTDVLGAAGTASSAGYRKIASYQMYRGSWNVNSVSKDAWKVVLGGLHATDFPLYDAISNKLIERTAAVNPFSRFSLPNNKGEASSDFLEAKRRHWMGYREITDEELDELAEKVVDEVRARGPFLSLAEFVNRRLSGTAEEMESGVIQAAIDQTKINEVVEADGIKLRNGGGGGSGVDISQYKYLNKVAAAGNSAQGAPGSLTQGHVMNALGNAVTVRSDTFTVRAYGESVNAKGKVLARAWCEAVVQRTPDYLDSADLNEVKTADLTSSINSKFGRRLRIVSFHWLGRADVRFVFL